MASSAYPYQSGSTGYVTVFLDSTQALTIRPFVRLKSFRFMVAAVYSRSSCPLHLPHLGNLTEMFNSLLDSLIFGDSAAFFLHCWLAQSMSCACRVTKGWLNIQVHPVLCPCGCTGH
jgi:hypothetical protein